jgi:hypothetical protein
MEMLSFNDVISTKPGIHGDLHVVPEGFYFLGFRKRNELATAIQANLGLLGMFLMHRSEKKRKAEMAKWRADYGGRHLDELVQEMKGSWSVSPEDIKVIKPRFVSPGLVIEHIDGRKFSVEMKKKNYEEIRNFVKEQGWAVK